MEIVKKLQLMEITQRTTTILQLEHMACNDSRKHSPGPRASADPDDSKIYTHLEINMQMRHLEERQILLTA